MLNGELCSIDDIIREHRGHFFSRNNMSFWKSRLPHSAVYVERSKELLFITSERWLSGSQQTRKYTVRAQNFADGSISTHVTFDTRRAAQKYVQEQVRLGEWASEKVSD